ncbi:unnamed protein product [Pedinophyceae sp. YPF-701]|nr:unnamed protein product [Pedinophyceae sp. YPF-701]
MRGRASPCGRVLAFTTLLLALPWLAHNAGTAAAFAFSDGASDPRYVVAIANGARDLAGASPDRPVRVIPVRDPMGPWFDCEVPLDDAGEHGGADGQTGHSSPRDRSTAGATAALQPLVGNCLHRTEGWWTYEVCHGQHVAQYHEENGHRVQEFTLGRSPGPPNVRVVRSDRIAGVDTDGVDMVTVEYSRGDMCDITRLPRRTAVVFHCAGDAASATIIESVSEPSTCNYEIRVATPLLCREPGFATDGGPVRQITCYMREAGDA